MATEKIQSRVWILPGYPQGTDADAVFPIYREATCWKKDFGTFSRFYQCMVILTYVWLIFMVN